MKYSIVIPVFNEQESVGLLTGSLTKVMDTVGEKYEIIFINDGSQDNTLKNLEKITEFNLNIRIINFAENNGQGKAMQEGFRAAKGEIIISMDGDLQNDPFDIPLLLSKIDAGFDLVCGWRFPRKDNLIKKIKSRIGNIFQKKITRLNLNDMGCTLRAYRKNLVKDISFRHKHDFTLLPYIISKNHAAKITEVKVKHSYRKFDKSKYGLLESAAGPVYSFFRTILSLRG